MSREASRRRVGSALLDLVARDGLAGASVRKVAAEAGCSAGAVQKYFGTVLEMFAFALDLAGERAGERLAAVDLHAPAREVVRNWILATLPLDLPRHVEARIWVEFAARAASHPPFARTLTETDGAVRDALAAFLSAAQGRGELPADVDVGTTAHALLAVADGLAVQLLYDGAGGVPTAPASEAALRALDSALTALLPQGARQHF